MEEGHTKLFKHRWNLICIPLTLLSTAAIAQDAAPKDVPPSHWAYTAVQDLAGKGLIKGYPPDNRFLGGRTLTRYEMASIIERVLARIDDLLGQKANKGDSDNKADKADIARLESSIGEVRDLIAEFRKELLVIGADLNAAKDEIASLKTQVGKAQATADEASTLADQALESIKEMQGTLKSVQDQMVRKDRAATLRVGGTFHAWAETAFGGTPNGNSPTNFSSSAPGRQFAASGAPGDTFRMKRAEIFFTGQMLPGSPNANPTAPDVTDKPGQAYYYVLLDTAKTISIANGSAQPNSTLLQDAFIGYQLARRFRFEIGQQKTDLDEEGSRSSSELFTAERAIMNLLPVAPIATAPTSLGGGGYTGGVAAGDVGRVGYVRDVGAVVRYNSSLGKAMIGIWNGNGSGQGTSDSNRQHFADFNVYYTRIPHLLAGIWGGMNIGDSQPAFKDDRYGATLLYHNGQHLFEAEGAFTRDFSPLYASGNYTGLYQGSYGRGGYALYGYTVTNKVQLVSRFDVWDPAYQAGKSGASVTTVGGYNVPRYFHDLREYTFGVNYYPYGKATSGKGFLKDPDFNFDQRFKLQLNYIYDDVESNGTSFWGKSRHILLANFQAAF